MFSVSYNWDGKYSCCSHTKICGSKSCLYAGLLTNHWIGYFNHRAKHMNTYFTETSIANGIAFM